MMEKKTEKDLDSQEKEGADETEKVFARVFLRQRNSDLYSYFQGRGEKKKG